MLLYPSSAIDHMFIMPSVNHMITMAISKEDNILMESLYETKVYGMRKLLKRFPQKNRTKICFDSLITC